MNVLKKSNENYDRFIFKRSHEPNTLNYFHMKEQLEDSKTKDDKMMVDAYDETGNNEIAYNALLQSEILDISDDIIRIPINDEVAHLNAACSSSIALYQFSL